MAKGQTQAATAMSSGLAKSSAAQTQAGLFGGGAFGPGGLTPQYTTQAGEQQQSRGAAFESAQNVAKTGGFDPVTQSTISEFEKTGGFTPQDKSRYLREATSGVANTYRNLMQQQQQRQAATGGLGGGDTTSQMARQLGQAQAGATTKAEADLQQQISANRLAGAGLGVQEAAGMREGSKIMQSMYNADTGALTATGQQILSFLGIDASNQQAAMSVMAELAKRPGLYDNILRAFSVGTFQGDPGQGAG